MSSSEAKPASLFPIVEMVLFVFCLIKLFITDSDDLWDASRLELTSLDHIKMTAHLESHICEFKGAGIWHNSGHLWQENQSFSKTSINPQPPGQERLKPARWAQTQKTFYHSITRAEPTAAKFETVTVDWKASETKKNKDLILWESLQKAKRPKYCRFTYILTSGTNQ